MVSALITRMDRWLAANRPVYYAQLRPGVSDEALDAFERRFGLVLPEAFRALYHWRDGQRAECDEGLEGMFMLSSLERIAEAKELLDGMIGYDFEDPAWWRASWVPFLDNGNGDHLVVDLGAEDGGVPGQVCSFWHDWEDRAVRAPSVEAWLTELVAAMEAGTLSLE